jgi:SAM-dependent MidA family methyltransferase
MGSSSSSTGASASPEFLAAFREHAAADGTMTFARFMELALYHPALGYYRQKRERVGYGQGSDFFTASTSGPVFGELISAACVQLLGGRGEARDYTFFEVGAELNAGVMNDVAHPFASYQIVRVGEEPHIRGKCIVFSNELFDAQPFHRFVFRGDTWREIGVALQGREFVEVELANVTSAPLPATAPEGYRMDLSLAGTSLAERLSAPGWSGLFIACDYGKSWRELIEATPQGTARAYYQHTQSNDLLARPGQQDLTSHVCWDWLGDILRQNGFRSPVIESQEAFFIYHAADFIARTSAAEAAQFSRKKLSLMQLLHPSHLGQKFQVLHAWRD